eukprot:TRINITY_DN12884_c0_g1_i4.p1 TRINITY_DN12884_c0_g1~~TRINITY_DN12884_c0_g1_i4.p1  ORF type:complete len:147 (-),score=8.88 TRINITY_DN12884_c0_g1_i4:538-978(-)
MYRQKGAVVVGLFSKALGKSATGGVLQNCQSQLSNSGFLQFGRTVVTAGKNTDSTSRYSQMNAEYTRNFYASTKQAQQARPQGGQQEEVKYLEAQPLFLESSVEQFPIPFSKIFLITFPDVIQSIVHAAIYAVLILAMCEFLNLFA